VVAEEALDVVQDARVVEDVEPQEAVAHQNTLLTMMTPVMTQRNLSLHHTAWVSHRKLHVIL